MDADSAPSAVPESGPEEIVYRRRQSDWLSDASPAAGAREESGAAARGAAIELAKATLIARDGPTSDHSDDVGLLCEAIAKHFRLADRERTNLMAAAQLHDIGKVGVSESILQKPGPLTEAEWEVMRQHTLVGARILSAVPELRDVAVIVRHSHEHWDGSGYPEGLAGGEIPLESRIILCADAFHAVRSPRPYRAGRSAQEALNEIKANSGGQFDPRVVAALERTVKELRFGRRASRFSSAKAALGSRRLAALLLAMAVAGSAFAALRGPLWRDGQAAAVSAPPACGDGCSSRRPSPPASASAPSDNARSPVRRPARSAAPRPPGAARKARRAGDAGGQSGPTSRRRSAPAAPAPGGAPGLRAPHGPALRNPSAVGNPQGLADGVEAPRRKDDPDRAPGHQGGNAYGHQKRPLNPHPPKLPPGRLKPKSGR